MAICRGVNAEDEPVGINNYNALQANFKHRFSAGLLFTASYTFSKFLSDVGGPEEWGSINGDDGSSGIRNFYDLKADWSVDGDDIPHSLVLNYVYELPVGRGKRFGSGMNAVEDAESLSPKDPPVITRMVSRYRRREGNRRTDHRRRAFDGA